MNLVAERLILNILFVTYLSNVECAQHSKFLQEVAPSMKHLDELVKAVKNQQPEAPHRKLVSCQIDEENTLTPEDEAFCNAKLIDIACSTGINQGFVDAELSCSRDIEIEQAQRDANACARNERGVYCSSALALFSLGGIRHNDIVGNCSQTEVVITFNSCPLACRTLLEDFRRQLGCCINAYINGSSSYNNIVDYRLWNLCDVPLPAENCDNSPTINRPVDVQACTYEEFFNKQFSQNICLPQ